MTEEEPMEELDFSPLQEVINDQKKYIEALQDELDDYKASFSTLEREKEDLEDKVKELETDIILRNTALEHIGNLVSDYV